MNFRDIAKEYIRSKATFQIEKSDETWSEGVYHFVIVAVNSNGFWTNAFTHEKTARRYCEKLGLKVLETA